MTTRNHPARSPTVSRRPELQPTLIQLIQKVILDSFETQLCYFIFCRAPRLYLAEASLPLLLSFPPPPPTMLILHSGNLTFSYFLHLCSYPPPAPHPKLHLLAISYFRGLPWSPILLLAPCHHCLPAVL